MRWLSVIALVGAGGCPLHALEPAKQAYRVELPLDDAAHPTAQTELFHWHGHLIDEQQRRYDFFLGTAKQHTDLDRVALIPVRFFVDPFHLSYFSLSDREAGRYHFRSKRSFPDVWSASASTTRLFLRHDSWRMEASGDTTVLRAGTPDAKISLRLRPGKRPSLRGGTGFWAAPPKSSNHYYSYTRLDAEGEVEVEGERRVVKGSAWFKHMWGSLYDEAVRGWAWFAVQLDAGVELEMALVFDQEWALRPESFASLVEADGTARELQLNSVGVRETGAVWHSSRTGGDWPVGWVIELPGRGSIELATNLPDQEIAAFPAGFWAGTLSASGVLDGKQVRGDAFAELVGWVGQPARVLYSSGR